jgi:hypothetical protein
MLKPIPTESVVSSISHVPDPPPDPAETAGLIRKPPNFQPWDRSGCRVRTLFFICSNPAKRHACRSGPRCRIGRHANLPTAPDLWALVAPRDGTAIGSQGNRPLGWMKPRHPDAVGRKPLWCEPRGFSIPAAITNPGRCGARQTAALAWLRRPHCGTRRSFINRLPFNPVLQEDNERFFARICRDHETRSQTAVCERPTDDRQMA